MHPQHLAALAQMRHEEYQEYARRTTRTESRRHSRRWKRLRALRRSTAPSRYRTEIGSDAAAAVEASGRASAIAS
jgi:hypothetical protein